MRRVGCEREKMFGSALFGVGYRIRGWGFELEAMLSSWCCRARKTMESFRRIRTSEGVDGDEGQWTITCGSGWLTTQARAGVTSAPSRASFPPDDTIRIGKLRGIL